MPVPYTFGTATTSIPLSNLDANFNTPVTIGNTTVGLGNTVTTIGNLTLTNATISTGNVTVTTGIFGAGSNTAPSITTTGDTNTGIYFPAADTIAFTEGGVESMRIDASGNVGLKTTPSAWNTFTASLQIEGASLSGLGANNTALGSNAYYNSAWKYYGTGSATLYQQNAGLHTWQYAGSGTAGNNITFSEAMRIDSSGNVGIGSSDPAGFSSRLCVSGGRLTMASGNRIGFWDSGNLARVEINSPAQNTMAFYTADGLTERMRITSSGQLLVGATSSSAVFYVNGNSGASFGSYVTCNINGGAATAVNAESPCNIHVQFYNSGTVSGSITVNGASAVSYNTSSDYRLKEDIAPMINALYKVALLKPVTYKWKVDGTDGQGFIAHELAEICPDAVSGKKDAVNEDGSIKPQGIDTSFLVATLTAAIQELNAKVEAQAVRIAELEGAK